MATRFRIKRLSQEEIQRLTKIWSVTQAGETLDKFLDKVENGEVPNSVNFANPQEKADFAAIASKLPDKEQTLRDFIEQTKDETNLTDQELKDRLEAITGLKETGEIRTIDRQKLKEYFKGKLLEINPRRDARALDNRLKNLLDKAESGDVSIDTDLRKSLLDPSDYHRLINAGYFYREGKPKFGLPEEEDVSRIEDILSARGIKAQRESSIEDYLAGLPGELQKRREEFLVGEKGRAVRAFEENVPKIQEALNVSGRLFGGGLPTALGESALDISGILEATQIELESEDLQFYFDAAYRNQFRKSLETREDYREALAEERSRVFSERGERFQQVQSALDRQLRESLKTDEYERALQTSRARQESQRLTRTAAEREALFSGIGGSVGAIGGAIVGGPAGAVVGSQIGATIPKTIS